MRTSFVFLAEGFEDIEAITVIDVLRRAGMDVKTVSISSSLQVRSAHGNILTADLIYDATHFTDPDWLILPGGMPGATNLYEFSPLAGLLRRQMESPSGHIAAICAAPAVVLGQLGLLQGRRATCYPGFEKLCAGAEMIDTPVVADEKMVLGNGPANALVWALNIVKVACGVEAAEKVASGMLYFVRARKEDEMYDFG
ncbi:MAG: DJ-1/PfpI family protein [Bacteroidales bacterium]|nr:DJ-1/PfpI family protein [Bacteroidales bacterium]